MTKLLILALFLISFNFGHSEPKADNFKLILKNYSGNNFQETYDESQLIGNWFFLSKDNDSKSKSENLMEGKYITIKIDHQFESDIFENLENGNWSFDKETQTLTLKHETKSSKWKLQKINDFGMILINIETSEKWMFAAE